MRKFFQKEGKQIEKLFPVPFMAFSEGDEPSMTACDGISSTVRSSETSKSTKWTCWASCVCGHGMPHGGTGKEKAPAALH